MARNASKQIKTGIVRKLKAGVQHTAIEGADATLLQRIIQTRPTPGTIEPYIYVRADESEEVQVTKTASSTDYFLSIECVSKANHNASAQVTLDGMVDEVSRVLDVETDDYIDVDDSNLCIQIQNVDSVFRTESEEKGATYFKATITVMIRAQFVGQTIANQPIQAPIFTYQNWVIPPTTFFTERHDAGSITTQLTGYDSPNLGWNFVDGSAVIAPGANGSIVGNVYTIGNTPGEDIRLNVALNYELATDDTTTFTLSTNNAWPRIRSVRYGTSTAQSFTDNDAAVSGLQNLADFIGDDRTIVNGTDNPNGQSFTITGVAGDYMYIIYDANFPDLTSIMQNLRTTDITNRFAAPVTVGGFKIYVANDPLSFAADYGITLNT